MFHVEQPQPLFHVEHSPEGLGQIWSSRKTKASELLPGTEMREAPGVGGLAPDVIQTTRVVSEKIRRSAFANCAVGFTACREMQSTESIFSSTSSTRLR